MLLADELAASSAAFCQAEEVIKLNGNDTSLETIKFLFFRQIKHMTLQANGIETFDVQFSDQWLR